MMHGFEVYETCCENCLLSPDAIVSANRRRELIRETTSSQSYFVCHKSTMTGGSVCCRGFYDQLGDTSQMIRIAQRLGAVRFVPQPDSERLPSYREVMQ